MSSYESKGTDIGSTTTTTGVEHLVEKYFDLTGEIAVSTGRRGLGREMALTFAGFGAHVVSRAESSRRVKNAISAGPFLTDIAKAWSEKAREAADNSMKRSSFPEEIVTTAFYLASSASSFTTGAIIRCDCGMG